MIISLIVVVVAFTIGVAVIALDRRRLTERLEEEALLLARSVAVAASEPLLRGESWGLHKLLR